MRHSHSVLRLLLCGIAMAGCDSASHGGRYTIEEVREITSAAPRPTGRGGDEERFFGSRIPSSGRALSGAATPSLAWTLPEGWNALAPTALRQGNFTVANQPEIECSVMISQGDGGGVVANLDRWRRQMSLPPMGPGEAEALPLVPILGGSGPLVDLRGSYAGMGGGEGRPQWRMLGAVRTLPAVTVFVKMTGPDDAVALERERFLALCATLSLAASPVPSAHDGHAHEPDAPAPFTWTVPEGWTVDVARSMRVVTLKPAGHPDAECYVAVLGGDGGGILANINRWRGQMGLGPITEAEVAALPRITVLGDETPLLDCEGSLSGMDGGEGRGGFSMLGIARLLPDGALFVKCTGPTDVLRTNRDAFIAFCGSLSR